MSEHRSVLKSTSTISALTIVSRIFGYIRDNRIAALLGTGDLADAYSIAFRIPNTIRRLVGEGAVSASFIPVFTQYLAEGKRKEVWTFVNAILSAAIVAMSIVVIVGILGSSYIVGFFASGFDPEKLHSTTMLNRIIFPYIGFVSLSAIAMGVLNSFGRFGAPAFAPVLLNVSIITLSLFADLFPNPAMALSVGVVIGGALQILVQIPSLLRVGWRLRWVWDLAHPGVGQVARLIGPRLFGIGIVQIEVLVGTQFASHMIPGSVASIGLADRVMELVLGGYAIALSTAVLPLLARQAASNRIDDMKNTLSFAMRLALFITMPATAGLILLRTPIIEVLFERGKFDQQSAALTAWALLFFAVGLSAFSVVKIVVQAFYALHDTRTPVVIGAFSLVVNIALNFLFFRWLRNGGPPLATSLAAFFDTFALLLVFRSRYGSLGLRSLGRSCLNFLFASLVMGVVTYVFIHIPGVYDGALPQRTLALVASIALATGAYFGIARILRFKELQEMGGIFAHRSAPEDS
jgi:putative peptidoglycan lipid II flippase